MPHTFVPPSCCLGLLHATARDPRRYRIPDVDSKAQEGEWRGLGLHPGLQAASQVHAWGSKQEPLLPCDPKVLSLGLRALWEGI